VRTIRLCSVVFGVTLGLAVIHTFSGRPTTVIVYSAWRLVVQYQHTRSKQKAGRRCDIQPWCSGYWLQSQIFVENRDFSLPHLHSTPPLMEVPVRILTCRLAGKTRMVWLPDGEKCWRYVYSFWQNPRTWRTDGHTQRHLMTAKTALGRSHRAEKIEHRMRKHVICFDLRRQITKKTTFFQFCISSSKFEDMLRLLSANQL